MKRRLVVCLTAILLSGCMCMPALAVQQALSVPVLSSQSAARPTKTSIISGQSGENKDDGALQMDPFDLLIDSMDPNIYGGVYKKDNGDICVTVIDQQKVQAVLSKLKSPEEYNIVYEPVKYSLKQLNQAQDALWKQKDTLGFDAIGQAASINGLIVFMQTYSEADKKAILDASSIKNIKFYGKQVTKGWWECLFELDQMENPGEKISSVKLYRYSDQTCVSVGSSLGPQTTTNTSVENDQFSYLSALAPSESGNIGQPLTDLSMLEIVLDSDVKYTYRLYERGIEVSWFAPGPGLEGLVVENKGPVKLSVNTQAYQTLLASLRARMEKGLWGAGWLSVMRQTNIKNVTVTASDGKSEKSYDRESAWFDQIVSSMQHFSVKPESVKRVSKMQSLNDASHVKIHFFNGIIYNVWHNGNTLLVSSSDMQYALKYQSDSTHEMDELDGMARGEINPLTAKPVIYLYPQLQTDVSVNLNYKGDFTRTDPVYSDGWSVTAYPDGHLVNKADGKTYSYLFWEGSAVVNWKFDEGFVVRGEDAESFLREKLARLGLIEREYNEFIAYWLPELQQNAYNLVTFSTDQYEALAPLSISPSPDSILRVHMVYKKLEQPVTIKPQQIRPFVRKGFAVVEWGGSRAACG